MPDRLFRRGNIWYGWYYTIDGRQVRESLRTTSKTIARAKLRALESLAADPAPHKASGQSMSACLSDYLEVGCAGRAAGTLQSYRVKAGHLARVLGGDVLDLDYSAVCGYVTQRRTEGAGASTIYKEIVVLRGALKEARRRGVIDYDPAAVIPRLEAGYRPRERWLTRAEYDRLQVELTPRKGHRVDPSRRLWVALHCLGSCNLSEAEGLRWEDVEGDTLHIRGTKRESRDRRVPICPELGAMIEELGARRGPLVARWRNATRDLAVLCDPAATSNDLRRTFASWLVQAGVDTFVVAILMGHTSARMVERVYGRLDMGTLRSAVAMMPRRGLAALG